MKAALSARYRSPDVYGAHAEYLCLPETAAMAVMPVNTPFGQAVVCEGAWYADTTLQAFGLKPGYSILIDGASGAISTAAVQLARLYGATVTAVVATRHLDLVSSLGADRAIDCLNRTVLSQRRISGPGAKTCCLRSGRRSRAADEPKRPHRMAW
jgi:NADPH:quinone reductase-like Zn-dependent oxidoreductase